MVNVKVTESDCLAVTGDLSPIYREFS